MTQNDDESQIGWNDYYEVVAGRPPREFLVSTLKRFDSAGAAIDLGCGTGALMEKLPPYSQAPFGADISREMLVQAHEKPGMSGRLVVADGHQLPLADESVDAITCLISFHFYLEPLKALQEMHRVLAPNGRLFMAALTAFFFESEII